MVLHNITQGSFWCTLHHPTLRIDIRADGIVREKYTEKRWIYCSHAEQFNAQLTEPTGWRFIILTQLFQLLRKCTLDPENVLIFTLFLSG